MGLRNAGLYSMDIHQNLSPQYISVADLTRAIKKNIEHSFGLITVKGEVSNFKAHHSGHWYFTLKDDFSQLPVVMWRSNNIRQNKIPNDGQEILIIGNVTVYERGGRYQFDAREIRLTSEKGDLFKRFEQLKKQLAEKGFFDPDKKKEIPEFPESVLILSSPTGAALQDILNVLSRRNPLLKLNLLSIPVQGIGAEKKISRAFSIANQLGQFDVILLARGGGSIEDLWPFNEMEVAQAINESSIPVITGIGHETDFTIADFTADYRAPTPSAAAEIITPDIFEILSGINAQSDKLSGHLKNKISQIRQHLRFNIRSLKRNHPGLKVNQTRQTLDIYQERLNYSIRQVFKRKSERLNSLENLLQSLNPHAILDRGYALVKKENQYISSSLSLKRRDKVEIIFKDGNVAASVEGQADG